MIQQLLKTLAAGLRCLMTKQGECTPKCYHLETIGITEDGFQVERCFDCGKIIKFKINGSYYTEYE